MPVHPWFEFFPSLARLSVVFRTTAPDFLAAYETARVIINRPATRDDDEEPLPLAP
jgi:hypothetical protein